MPAGTLYVVATPIGNLQDITLRALDVLRSVSLVACEDTRRTRVLLDRHGIAATLVPFHKFNERKASPSLVQSLLAGASVALVSDGGTPAVSDPGYRLVRDALDAGITVTPIPGPSAFVAAVSASGLPSECVIFRGFLPHRAGERRRLIESVRSETATIVFYESPHRVSASLRDLADILGDRRAAVAREMTKRFETWHRGSLSEVAQAVARGPAKGEFCLVVEGSPVRPRARAGTPLVERDPARRARAVKGRVQAARMEKTDSPRATRTRGQARGEDSAPDTGTSGGPDASPTGQAAHLQREYAEALAKGGDRREALRSAARACGLSRKEAYRILNTD